MLLQSLDDPSWDFCHYFYSLQKIVFSLYIIIHLTIKNTKILQTGSIKLVLPTWYFFFISKASKNIASAFSKFPRLIYKFARLFKLPAYCSVSLPVFFLTFPNYPKIYFLLYHIRRFYHIKVKAYLKHWHKRVSLIMQLICKNIYCFQKTISAFS